MVVWWAGPLLSSDGKSLLNLYTIKEIPEFVTGVEGKALRTDGYSTWMDTTTEGDVSSLSGWFALESYPTDTAAFMGIRDMAGTSVAVCVDRYGELLLGMGQNAQISGLQCLQSLYAQALQLMCSIPQYDSIFKNFFFKKSWEMKKVWKINTSETCGTANKKGNVP